MSEMGTDIQTQEIRIGKRATVVIPAAMRKALGIGDGDRLQATVCDAIPDDPIERLRRAFRGVYDGVDATAYIRALRDEWDDEI